MRKNMRYHHLNFFVCLCFVFVFPFPLVFASFFVLSGHCFVNVLALSLYLLHFLSFICLVSVSFS